MNDMLIHYFVARLDDLEDSRPRRARRTAQETSPEFFGNERFCPSGNPPAWARGSMHSAQGTLSH